MLKYNIGLMYTFSNYHLHRAVHIYHNNEDDIGGYKYVGRCEL